ncbi:hypothetical protein Airi01_078700 [Actinoallomurus iriomotensis]|uniref:Sel1 repeat family protein n=2 Tax=Actinoallomurus iriomotensis TaxID=478107 RepID=A0A9W6RPW1_9ACTN|nr:hypothetical protein Airi01_078700 [Actinoallomurus iriomotensis]
MSDPPAGQYTLDHLIQDMQELRRASGQPSMRTVVRDSARVADAYSRQGYKDAAQLSLTALADTLAGRRKNPPRWSWLIVYVQTCREIARRSPGLHDGMSDEEAVALWRKRHDAVHAAEDPPPKASPRWSPRPPNGSAVPPPGAPAGTGREGHAQDRLITRPDDARRRSGPPGGSSPPPGTATSAQWIGFETRSPSAAGTMTLTQERLATAYGPHGLDLLDAAETRREPDASYRIGLLLILDGHRHEGLAWLMQAEYDGRHPLATGIIELDTPAAAIEQAFALGEFSATGHDLITATVYYRRAAKHGHLSAAYRLAEIYDLFGDHTAAKRWRAWASELERGHTTLSPERLPLSSSPAEVTPAPIDDPSSTPPGGLPVLG